MYTSSTHLKAKGPYSTPNYVLRLCFMAIIFFPVVTVAQEYGASKAGLWKRYKDPNIPKHERFYASIFLSNRYLFESRDSILVVESYAKDRVLELQDSAWLGLAELHRGTYHRALGRTDSALQYFRRGLRKIPDQPFRKTKLHFFLSNAGIYSVLRDTDSIQYYVNRAYQLVDSTEEVVYYGTILRYQGNIAYANGKFVAAADYWRKLLEYAEEKGNKALQVEAANNLKRVYATFGLEEEKQAMAKKAMSVLKTMKGDFSKYQTLRSTIILSKSCSEATQNYQASENLADSIKVPFASRLSALETLITRLDELNCHSEAYTYAELYLSNIKNLKDSWTDKNKNRAFAVMMVSLNGQDKYREAKEMALKVLRISRKTGIKRRQKSAVENLSRAYEGLGQLDSAFFYLKQYFVLEEDEENSELEKKIFTNFLEYRTNQEKKMIRLQKDQETQLARSRLNRQRLITLFVTLFSIALLLLAIFIYQNLQLKKKAQEKLKAINKQLVTEQEKLKISQSRLIRLNRSLKHDIVSNLDILISFGQINVKPNPNIANLKQFYRQTIQTVHNLKSYSQSLVHDFESTKNHQSYSNTKLILQEVLDSYQYELKDKFEVKVGSLPNLPINSVDFSQILHNLISNAIKFSRNTEKPKLTIDHIDKQDEFIIYISDNGKGIKTENLDRIFDDYSSFNSNGNGLGLSIVRSILQEAGGKITVRSSYGNGATFYLHFPKTATESTVKG